MSTCVLWKGAVGKGGYGNLKKWGRYFNAHRVAWIEKFGSIKKGLVVCHRCDNKLCINTAHLFIGTQKQNIHDQILKGRNLIKVPKQVVEKIRLDYAANKGSYHALGRKYEVSKSHVYRIVNRATRVLC